jgi:dTDP-4-amino-4,6-dideoxygalactose transaminase
LDALQAAILSIKISHLDEWTRARQKNAALYREIFAQKGLDVITPPKEAGGRHIYNQFVVRVGTERDNLRKFLEDNGIGCEVYYPVPLHMQGCFRYLNHRPDDFPVSRDAAQETLALPIFPELEENEIVYVVDIIEQFIKKVRKAFFLRDPQKKA